MCLYDNNIVASAVYLRFANCVPFVGFFFFSTVLVQSIRTQQMWILFRGEMYSECSV